MYKLSLFWSNVLNWFCTHITFKLSLPFCDSGIYAYTQGLKEEHDISKLERIILSWKECEQRSGALLSYEVKLYNDQHVYTKRLVESVTSYTILPEEKLENCFPKAISVAAISGIVGNHCPPVEISLRG